MPASELSRAISYNVSALLAKRPGRRVHGWSDLSRRMAEQLRQRDEVAAESTASEYAPASVERTLRDFRRGLRNWRIDYLEAAAAALAVHPAELVTDDGALRALIALVFDDPDHAVGVAAVIEALRDAPSTEAAIGRAVLAIAKRARRSPPPADDEEKALTHRR